ncbi:DUF3703 domain-containing protein, partial [Nocardia asiatica]|uniref:DUF3703 domain-containing protein n=1 Tax=Nocardia asiatica TaxID=209252 RepID=UPI003CC7EEEB
MPAPARGRYHDEKRAAATTPGPDQRWAHLERAHILSQPDPWLHTRNHIAMFTLAVRQRDRREALCQVVRIIVAAPGGQARGDPEGNTRPAPLGRRPPMAPPP